METKWRIEDKVSKAVRSNIEAYRIRCESLEKLVGRNLNKLIRLRGMEPNNSTVDEYLNWVYRQIHSKDVSDILQNQNKRINMKIKYFKKRFKYLSLIKDILLNQSFYSEVKFHPYFDFKKFIENGLGTFFNLIDSQQIWLEHKELYQLVYSRTPTLLSYVIIAFFARFTLSQEDPYWLVIYETSIKRAKAILHEALLKPSYHKVVALGLLTHLGISYFAGTDVLRYFTLAVNMAQSLGYDKLANCVEPNLDHGLSSEVIQKGVHVWRALTLTYLLISTYSPNFPNFGFSLKSKEIAEMITINSKRKFGSYLARQNSFQLAREMYITFPLENKLSVSFISIISHVQNLKMKFSISELKDTPPEQLRLPIVEFNRILTCLASFYNTSPSNTTENSKENVDYVLTAASNLVTYRSTFFTDHSRAVVQLIYIFLYYPSILVFPRTVQFTNDEQDILFQAACHVTSYFKEVLNTIELQFETDSIKKMEIEPFLTKANCSPLYFLHCPYPIYVYFNIISCHQSSNNLDRNKSMIEAATSNSIFILKFLNIAKDFIEGNHFFSPSYALDKIAQSLTNFNLPIWFLDEITKYLKNKN